MTTKPSVSVKLDLSRLLGFDQLVEASEGGERPLDGRMGSKIGGKPLLPGAKIGSKVGGKPTAKIGAKVGSKPGSK